LNLLQQQKATLNLALSTLQTKLLVLQSGKVTTLHTTIVEIGGSLKDAVTAVGTQVAECVQTIGSSWKRAEILKWYKTSDPEQNHRVSREKHRPNTASWVFDVKDFVVWSETQGKQHL
jgi:hypothetical protein